MAKNPVAISKLATASRMPSARPSGLAQAASTGQQLASLMKAGSGAYDWAKNKMPGVLGGGSANLGTAGFNPQGDEWVGGNTRTTTGPISNVRASLEDMYAAPASDTPIDLGDSSRAIELAKFPEDAFEFLARGGRTGYNLRGGVPYKDNGNFDPSEGPRAPNDEGYFSDLLGSVIDSGASQPKGRPDAPPSARPQGGDSGIGGLTKLAKAGKSMYDAGSKAASGLGKLTGTAAEAGAPSQLAGATLANEGATGLGGVLAADLPALGAAEAGGAGLGALGGEAAGAGLGALGAEAAGAAGAAGAALGAEALGATAAAAAPAALGATAAAAAPAAAAVGGEALLAMLPFLLSDRRSKHDDEVVGHLFDGQPVHTFKYNNGDNRTRMGMMTDESDRSAVHNIGGLEMLDYKRATDVATGLAPRQAAQTGGLFVDPNMPAEGAVETALNVPRELQPLIAKASAETGIPASIIAATIAQESRFSKDAVGGAGEIGLMQVKPSTAARPGFGVPPMSLEKLKTPAGNITFGSNYLAGRARNLGVDPSDPAAIAAYNSGSAKDEYARKVMAKAGQYDPAVDAKYADTPARGAIEVAKGLNNQAEGMPGDNRRPFSSEPGQFVKDTPRSAPFRTGGKGLLSSMGVSPKTAEALTSENFVVPALAGIGSMLASTRPTLGGAIGEGLVGGTSAYTALRKQEADEEKAKGPAAVEAERARNISIGNVQKSLQQIGNTRIVWLANGTPMRYGDYMDLVESGKAPELLGRVPTGPEAAKKLREAAISPEGAPVPATPAPEVDTEKKATPDKKPVAKKLQEAGISPEGDAAPVAPPPNVDTEKKATPDKKPAASPYIDNNSIAVARQDRKIVENGGDAGAIAAKAAEKYSTAVKNSAEAARESARYMGDLAENLAKAAQGKGINVAGFGFNRRAQIIGA
jgi:hypothetical protein